MSEILEAQPMQRGWVGYGKDINKYYPRIYVWKLRKIQVLFDSKGPSRGILEQRGLQETAYVTICTELGRRLFLNQIHSFFAMIWSTISLLHVGRLKPWYILFAGSLVSIPSDLILFGFLGAVIAKPVYLLAERLSFINQLVLYLFPAFLSSCLDCHLWWLPCICFCSFNESFSREKKKKKELGRKIWKAPRMKQQQLQRKSKLRGKVRTFYWGQLRKNLWLFLFWSQKVFKKFSQSLFPQL